MGGVSGQLRDSICLEVLRSPLREDEPIEFLDLQCGTWSPGRIFGRQASYATQVGYCIQLEGGPRRVIEMAPAERLRRRFPPRHKVEVYRGPRQAGATRLCTHKAIAYSLHH